MTVTPVRLSAAPTPTARRRSSLSIMFALAACLVTLSATSAWAQPVPAHGLNPNFGTNSIGQVEIQLVATGGNGIYTWSIVGGTPPPGVVVRMDSASWPSYFGATTSGALLGVATTPGVYNFTLRVTSNGQSVDQNATVTITPLDVGGTWRMPRGFVGKPYTHTLTAQGAAGTPSWTVNGTPTLTALGLSLSTSGVITGTPNGPFSGYINFRLTDGVHIVFDSRYLEIFQVEVTSTPPNAVLGLPYLTTLTATGGTPPYTWALGNTSLPSGLTLTADGTISGTPTCCTGPSGFTVTATDAVGRSSWKNTSIDGINAPQPAPRLQPYGRNNAGWSDCTIGWGCDLGVSVFSGGTAPFTASITGQPAGLAVGFRDDWWSRDIFIGGVPTQAGDFTIRLTVADADGVSTTQEFPLHVSRLLQRGDDFRPLDLVNGTLGQFYTKAVTVTGGTPPYSVTQIGGVLPPGLTFDPATRTLSGTPLASGNNFNAVLRYQDAVGNTLTVSDSFDIDGTGAGGTIDITSNDNLGTLVVGNSTTRTFTACCVPSYLWTAVDALPPGLSLSPDGVLSGTVTTAGIYSFLVRAADAQNPANFAMQRFTLTVLTANPLFVSTASTLPNGNEGTFYSVQLAATGAVGSATWTLQLGNFLPPGLDLAADGTISGTPTGTGQFGFTVVVTDGAANTTSRFFTIFVYPAGATAPLALPLGPILGPSFMQQLTFTLAATGGVGPYHYSFTPGAAPIPGMRVQDGPPLPNGFTSTGAFLGIPLTPGIYTSSIRVTDSVGTNLDRPFTFNVSPFQILSQTPLPKGTVGAPYSMQLEAYSSNGTPYAWSATNLPPGVSISPLGLLSGTPATAATYFPRLTLTDLVTQDAITTSYTLVVDPFAITTNGNLPVGTIGTPYSQTFTAPGCAGCTWSIVGSVTGFNFNGNVFSGTPNFTTSSLAVTIQATGSNGTVQKVFNLVVTANIQQPLFITTLSPLQDRSLGVSTAFTILAQGGTLPYTWAVDSGTMPDGIELSEAGETLGSNLRPGIAYLAGRAVEVGVFNFTLRVTDAVGATTTRAFTWNVSPLAYSFIGLPITGTTLVYGQPYSQKLLAMGGTGVYTNWTATNAMPSGLTLNPATGEVSGTPEVTGSITTAIRVTDDAGSTFFNNFTFNIAGPTATAVNFGAGPNLGTDLQGNSSRNLSLNGGTPPYLVEALTPLPPGYTLISGDALLSGAPVNSWFLVGTALAPGNFSFTLRATDSVGNVGARTFLLSVAAFSRLNNTNLANGSVGVPYLETLLAFSSTGSAVTWSVRAGSALPQGLNLSSGGVISGTPTVAGSYSFVLDGTDSAGVIRPDTFTMVVSTLAITGAAIMPQAISGQMYNHQFVATGSAGALVWSATGLPTGLSMSPGGLLSGVTNAFSGTSSLVVTVTDGVSPVTRRFTLFTRTPNPTQLSFAPASAVLADATVGQLFATTLILNGGVAPYTWTVAAGSTLPPGMTLLSGTNLPSTISPGQTQIGGVPTTLGNYSFDLIATDSVGTSIRRTFTLRVSSIGLLTNAIKTAIAGSAYAQQLTPVGGTPPFTFSMSPTSATQEMLPPGFSMTTSGLITGTTTSTGGFTFRLQVVDGGGNVFTRNQTVNVTNAAGVAVNMTNSADTPVGITRTTFLSVSGAAAGSTFSWSNVGPLPPGLSIMDFGPGNSVLLGSVPTPGLYTYTLRATQNGNPANTVDHTFTYRATPMQYVSPALNGAGVRDLPAGVLNTPYSFSFKVAGGTGPYTFSPSPFGVFPAGISVSSDGVLSGTPTQTGFFPVLVDVSDSSGAALANTLMVLAVTQAGTPNPLVPMVMNVQGAEIHELPFGFIGAPLADAPLDIYVRGGVAPFTWDVEPGSSLPPGVSIISGSNGVSDRLGGIPSMMGEFEFSLIATDAAGQHQTVMFEMESVPASFTGNVVPGVIGSAYSVTFNVTGGVPPYTFALWPEGDQPPGLTMGANGVLSGVPTHSGVFNAIVFVSDSVGNELGRFVRVTIDNAEGQAPVLSAAPTPIQVLYLQGGAPPAPVPVSIATTSDQLPFTVDVGGVPGASLSANGGTTPSAVNLNFNVTGLANGTYAGSVGVMAPGAANQWSLVPVTLTVASPPPCNYSLSKTATSVPANGAASYVNVTAGPTCAWTSVPSDPWITITAGAAGASNGKVNYSVAANPSPSQRSGSITVASQVLVITQFGSGCSFGINPVTISATATGGSLPVSVAASNSACSWTASSASGLGLAPSGGAGSASVTVTVPPNPLPASRVLTATIAGQVFTVNQSGINCTVTLGPYEATVAAAGATGTISVTTQPGCSYDTVPGPSWISVTSGGSGVGPGTLIYDVAANSTTLPRSGSLSIGGQTFSIAQDGLPCSITMNTASLGSPYNAPGGAGSIVIIANGPNCNWTASSGAQFAVVAPGTGTGNGTVFVTVGSNAGSVTGRSATLLVNGQNVGIQQAGTACTYALQSAAGSVPAAGGVGSVGVVAPSVCAWNSATNTPAWLTISSSGTSGTGEVAFVAQPNATTSPRVGTLTVAGLTYTVTQAAASCAYTLPIASISVISTGVVDNLFSFTANASGCGPVAVSYANWITNVSTAIGGTAGSVTYSVEQNPFSTPRVGTIQLGDRTFTVTQLGGACGYSLSGYGALFSKVGGTGSVFGSPTASGCVPDVGVTQPFVIKTTFGSPAPNLFQQDYNVGSYNVLNNSVRIGQIIFGGQVFTVKQSSW